MWMESDVIMVYRGFILQIYIIFLTYWVFQCCHEFYALEAILSYIGLCVCMWIYYSFSTHGLAMRLLLLEGCAWTHEGPNFPPLFEGFLEDWKTENHPVTSFIDGSPIKSIDSWNQSWNTDHWHCSCTDKQLCLKWFTVMTSCRGSYSHKISAEFHPIGPTVVRRALLYWHKLCFRQFSQRLIRSIHVHTI